LSRERTKPVKTFLRPRKKKKGVEWGATEQRRGGIEGGENSRYDIGKGQTRGRGVQGEKLILTKKKSDTGQGQDWLLEKEICRAADRNRRPPESEGNNT